MKVFSLSEVVGCLHNAAVGQLRELAVWRAHGVRRDRCLEETVAKK